MSKILLIGCGAVGQGLIPLLRKHFPEWEISAITADDSGLYVAQRYDVPYLIFPLTRENYAEILTASLSPGDIVVNVSVNVSSVDVMDWCQTHGVMYLDTVIEPWEGGYDDNGEFDLRTTNHFLRQQAIVTKGTKLPTAAICCGANPGLVSHFLKRTLDPWVVDGDYAAAAHKADVKAIHIAERDTQGDHGRPVKKGEFFNTWSPQGFISELNQHAEFGVGTHEIVSEYFYDRIDHCGILGPLSYQTRVKSWVPSVGQQECLLVTHHESLSLSDYLTVKEDGKVVYRPSVLYAYRPCEDAITSTAFMIYEAPTKFGLVTGNFGADELGVLMIYHGGAYWYGSTLDVEEDVKVPFNNATTMQVNANILGTLKWMLKNPLEGVVEAEEMDHEFILSYATPYLGKVHGVSTSWNPGKQLTIDEFLI